MKKIKLCNCDKYTLVDDDVFEWASKVNWYLRDNRYVRRTKRIGKRKDDVKINVNLHREILNTPKGLFTDHINGDTLDNRRSNLRIVTHSQNNQHRNKPSFNTSGYKGVYWHKRHKKWVTRIYVNNKEIHLGMFNDKIEAAKVYNEAAKKYHKQYAILNEIPNEN